MMSVYDEDSALPVQSYTVTGHGYCCSCQWLRRYYVVVTTQWYKTSYIWYMLAYPAQFCPRMLS
jgi:hypothetical protein